MLNCKKDSRNTTSLKDLAKKSHRALHAFSLIEMSLVLAIMGTVAGLSMPMLLEQHALRQQHNTQKNIDIVLTALGTYAASNAHLPCPASVASQGEPTYCDKDSKKAAVGLLPYKALGIQESSCQDGFGHPLRYGMDPSLAFKEFFQKERYPTLFINGAKGESLLSSTLKNDRLAVVIVGENQAYHEAKSSFEIINLDQGSSFVDAPFSTQKENPFRHHVRWSTRNNLLTRYGKSPPITPPKEADITSQTPYSPEVRSTQNPSPQPPSQKKTGDPAPHSYKARRQAPYQEARRRKRG